MKKNNYKLIAKVLRIIRNKHMSRLVDSRLQGFADYLYGEIVEIFATALAMEYENFDKQDFIDDCNMKKETDN